MPTVQLGRRMVAYRLRRSARRRHVALIVEADGSVTIAVPQQFDARRVLWVLESRRHWLERHLAEREANPPPPPKRFGDGESFLFLGHLVTLRLRTEGPTAREPVTLRDGRLQVRLASAAPAHVRSLLMGFYEEQARAYLPRRIGVYQRRVGPAPTSLKIREYKTRWGHCTAKGQLAFNWRLMQAPAATVDAVVVHELCHLVHLHHRAAFWQLVRSIMPRYDEAHAWLRANGRQLMW